MAVKIETPPALTGQAENKIQQLYAFLFRLSENLNVALDSLGDEKAIASAPEGISPSPGAKPGASPADTYNELRALIVNTAGIIRSEMDRVEEKLQGRYTAVSEEWGTFRESIDQRIVRTAMETVSSYNYDGEIDTLKEAAAGFSAYKISTEGYIRQGFIDYDGEGVPVVGIAIGKGLTTTAVTVGGVEYRKIDSAASCAFYTADRVSFRIGGEEAAYISNRRLYIGNAEITGSAVFGGKWILSHTSGLTLKWIGGAV